MSPALSTYFLVQNKIEFEKIKHESITKSDKLTEKLMIAEILLRQSKIMSPNQYPSKIIITIRLQPIEESRVNCFQDIRLKTILEII